MSSRAQGSTSVSGETRVTYCSMAWPLLACVFGALLICADPLRAADDAFLVVQKKLSIAKAKPASERLTVFISLHNVGFTTAYEVTLNDDTWPKEKFNLISGDTSNSWDKLDGGKSLTHTFILEPLEKGLFYGSPAIVKYRVATRAVLQEAYSTPIQELELLSEKSSKKKYRWLKVLAARYGPLVSVISFMGIFIYILVTPSKSKTAKTKKKK